jgi:LysR family glycine cleavage system transcriptional activator
VDAVLADAGLTLCGLALVAELVKDGRVSLPFSSSTGTWTSHVFQAQFRAEVLTRSQVRRFREWLVSESVITRSWLARGAASKQGP